MYTPTANAPQWVWLQRARLLRLKAVARLKAVVARLQAAVQLLDAVHGSTVRFKAVVARLKAIVQLFDDAHGPPTPCNCKPFSF